MTPVFHVADQPRPFHDAWYTDGELGGVPVLESIFLWTPAALGATDLIVNGVFTRHPQLGSASSSSRRSGCRCT